MAEINEKIMQKVNWALNTFLSADQKRNRMPNVQFKICERDGDFVVGLRSAIKGNEHVSNEDILRKIEDYYFNNGKPIRFLLEGKVLIRGLVKFLMQEDLQHELESKFIKTFFTVAKKTTYTEILGYIDNHIIKDNDLKLKAKRITVQILSQMGKERSEYDYGASWHDTNYLIAQIKFLQNFSISEEDYDSLHNFLNYYKENLGNVYSDTVKTLVVFLKKSIPVEHWEQFHQYINDKPAPQTTASEVFEEVTTPSYHLKINKAVVLQKHPVLSLASDYSNMIEVIVSNINKNAELLNIQYCRSLDMKASITDLYFLSKNEKLVDSTRIKKLFSYVLDEYASAMIQKAAISDNFMKKLFMAALMESDLNGKQIVSNTSNKRNKI